MTATAAQERDDRDDRIAALERDVSLLMALASVTAGRLAELEGVTAPLHVDEGLTTIKGAGVVNGLFRDCHSQADRERAHPGAQGRGPRAGAHRVADGAAASLKRFSG